MTFTSGDGGHTDEHNRIATTGYDVRRFGLVGDDATDNSATFAAMIAAIPAFARVTFPVGVFRFASQVTIPKALTIQGVGIGSHLKATSAVTGALLRVAGTSDPTLEAGYVQGLAMRDVLLTGSARSASCTAIELDTVQRALFDGVHIANFAGAAIDFTRRIRNNRFVGVVIKSCGTTTIPHIKMADSGTTDGHNNNYFVGCESVSPFGDHIHATKTDENSPIRNNFWSACMFHGATVGDDTLSYGETVALPVDPTNRVMLCENARGNYFDACRLQSGSPLFELGAVPAITNRNTLTVSGCSFGAHDGAAIVASTGSVQLIGNRFEQGMATPLVELTGDATLTHVANALPAATVLV